MVSWPKVFVLACLIGLGSACNLSGGGPPPAGGTIVLGTPADLDNTSPAKGGTEQDLQIYRIVYQMLTQPTPDGGVTGELATSWDTPSPTSYVFHLRSGVKFSNGRTMDSSDVVTTWDQYKAGGGLYPLVGPLKSVTAVDPLTVRFDLTEPDPALPKLLGLIGFVMPGKELLAGTFDPSKDLMGTGPFMVKSHIQGVSWTFVRNPYYWRQGFPKVDEVDLKIVSDEAARLAALKSGSIDLATFASYDTAQLLRSTPNTKVVNEPTTDLYYLELNAVNPKSPFLDQRVRQAISLGLNRQQIIDTALSGVGKPTGLPQVTFSGVGCNPAGVPGGSQDVAQAEALLKEAGVPNLTFNLLITTGGSFGLVPQIAQVLQSQLAKIGVKVTISSVDQGKYFDEFFGGQFDASISYFAGGPDAGHIVSYMNPKLIGFDSPYTADDPELDSLIDSVISTPDGSARTQSLHRVCERVIADANFVPLATRDVVVAYRTDRVSPRFLPVEPNLQIDRLLEEYTRV